MTSARAKTAKLAATTLAALCVFASGCREPNRADYVSARVRAHCTDPDLRRECRLLVMRHYYSTSLEEFQRTEDEPHLRSIWCFFQRACLPGQPGWPDEGAETPPVAASPR